MDFFFISAFVFGFNGINRYRKLTFEVHVFGNDLPK